MSLWGRQRREFQGVTPEGTIPPRAAGPRRGAVMVNEQTALRHSAVWACRRLRADLISTFPVEVYRDVDGIPVQMPLTNTSLLVNPGGPRWPWKPWAWASQFNLEGCGNSVGLITEVNALGLPNRVDLAPLDKVVIIQRKGETEPRYKIDGKEYPASKVWHERMFPVPGMAMGLSPLAMAAWSIGEYLSIQEFALDWFGGGAVPKARMRNKAKVLKASDITTAKQWYRDVIQNGDLLVYGADWEYDMIQAQQAGVEWIEGRRFGLNDACRFFGVPGELVDAALSSRSINYANMSQKNLDFLTLHLGPAVEWREESLTAALPRPRYAKLKTDKLLRLDPKALTEDQHQQIEDRTLTVTEARAERGRAPLTPEQEAEFLRLFPPKTSPGAPALPAHRVQDELMAVIDSWAADPMLGAPRSPIPIEGRVIDG